MRLGWGCSAGSGDQFLLFRPRHLMFPAQPLVSERLKAGGGQWRCRTKAGIGKFLALKSRWDCARLFISARPLGSARKGDFAHCSAVRSARSVPLFPTRPRRPFPSFLHCRRGRAAPPVIVAGPEGTAGAFCGPLAFRLEFLSTGVAVCRVSSSVRPRRSLKPVQRADASAVATRLFRPLSVRSFPSQSRSRRPGLNGCMKSN